MGRAIGAVGIVTQSIYQPLLQEFSCRTEHQRAVKLSRQPGDFARFDMWPQPASQIAAQHCGLLADLPAFYLQVLRSHPLKQIMSQIGVLYEPVDVSSNQPFDPLLGLLGFSKNTPYRSMDALEAFQIEGRGESLFALEVMVNAAHACTRPLLDVGHACFAEALCCKAIE